MKTDAKIINSAYPDIFPPASWTIILLINGENNLMQETENAYNQLANAGSILGDVNIVAIFDGLTINDEYHVMGRVKKGVKSYPNVYYVTRYRNLTTTATPLFSYPEKDNLAQEGALSDILQEIKRRFPAEHFGFIYKGHGGAGRTDISNGIFRVEQIRTAEHETKKSLKSRIDLKAGQGWIADSVFELNDNSEILMIIYYKDGTGLELLTYLKMRDELNNAGFNSSTKLAFLCLDCCWGQLIKIAELFKDTTVYFLGSADEMPVAGIGYEEFSNFLIKRPTIKPDELANSIVASFFKSNYDDYQSSPKWSDMGVSLTCTCTNNYNNVFDALNTLSAYLTDNIKRLIPIITMARHCCREYTNHMKLSYYAMYNIDLIWFLQNLHYFNEMTINDLDLDRFSSNLHQALRDFISSYMSSNYKYPKPGNPEMGGKGIAITFPENLHDFELSLYKKSLDGAFDDVDWKWKNFLEVFVNEVEDPGDMKLSIKRFKSYINRNKARFSDNGQDVPTLISGLETIYRVTMMKEKNPKWKKNRL